MASAFLTKCFSHPFYHFFVSPWIKKSNVRLFRPRSFRWVGGFVWMDGESFARSLRRYESFHIHPSRNAKADIAPCFRVAETQAGSSAALRSRCHADGRCLFSRSLRFDEGGGWGTYLIRRFAADREIPSSHCKTAKRVTRTHNTPMLISEKV